MSELINDNEPLFLLEQSFLEEKNLNEKKASNAKVNPLTRVPFLAHEFMLWLWFFSEKNFGSFNLSIGPVDLWVDDKMTFLSAHDTKATNTFSGGAPSTIPETKLSLLSGKVIQEMRIGIRQGSLEWALSIKSKSGDIVLNQIKIPAIIKSGIDEMLLERMALIENIEKVFAELFQQFFEARIDKNYWQKKVLKDMKNWIIGD